MGKHMFRSSPPKGTTPSPERHQTLAESAMEESMEAVHSVTSKWASSSSSSSSSGSDRGLISTPFSSSPVSGFLFSSNSRQEAAEFVGAVRDLQSTMHRLVSVSPASEKLIRAQSLMQSAMKFLESEFYRVLKVNREYLDPECVSVRSHKSCRFSTSSVSDSDGDNSVDGTDDEGDEMRFAGGDSDAMDDLRMIADCMISTGYAKECVRVYKTVRRSIADETLHNLGVERLSLNQIQKMDWETLESKIKSWLRAVKFAVRTLFYGERILADHVFSASSAIAESSFTDISQEGALTLFGFPENAAKFKRLSPEKMFRILDMYEALANLYPEIESIFYFDSTAAVRSQVINSLARLGDSVRWMMSDFESAIQGDSSKKPIPGGGVHPLTRYVMNYLSFLADYSDSVAAIFENWQLPASSPMPESLLFSGDANTDQDDIYSSPASVRIAWVILLTLCKVDGKAQPYKDVALSYLFLANNLQYVIIKVRSSNLKLLLGDEWVLRHEAKVKQYAEKFEKLAWGKVLTSLPEDPMAQISQEEAMEIFRRLNDEFESAYRKQSSWVIPDPKLRDETKVSLARKLIPSYREFYEGNRAELVRETYNEGIVRFTPEDLGNYLSDLYFGTRGSGNGSTVGSGSGSGYGSGSSASGHSRGR
ncbi:PREDICTED: exocyst complex component EXO70B1-like [Tarenaya hassleriana]|uniref:exocyst complex component EXO70B1-like n=1 Tax=Tarenaya hassleriana TaxID=28532 RepID=UPI00053C3B14|nr:PREDICTED: exocyst complex component EXO70B1-like [Tarenaya hassleriana]